MTLVFAIKKDIYQCFLVTYIRDFYFIRDSFISDYNLLLDYYIYPLVFLMFCDSTWRIISRMFCSLVTVTIETEQNGQNAERVRISSPCNGETTGNEIFSVHRRNIPIGYSRFVTVIKNKVKILNMLILLYLTFHLKNVSISKR